MNVCEKCGKKTYDLLTTVYGDIRCEDCWDDYLMTDRGKVEYFVGICREDYPMSDYDDDFLGRISSCWKQYCSEVALPPSEIRKIVAKAKTLGLL